MKTCNNCGTALPDEAGFCAVCGTAQAASAELAPQPVAEQPAYVPPVYVAPPAPYIPPQEEKKSVSVGGWIGRYCLNLIPFAGSLVFFIMLWVWAFSSKYDETSRNWAKAQLIVGAILAGVMILLVILFATLGFTFADVMDEAMYF